MKTSALIAFLTLCTATMPAQSIADIEAAAQYLSSSPCQRLEGLWQLSETETKVLIKLDESDSGYSIIVLESEDARLVPGDTIGTAEETPEPGHYKLKMKASGKNTVECAARLADNDRALYIEKPDMPRIRFVPRLYIPAFWGHITLSSGKQGSVNIRKGMTRLNPDGSSSQSIIYL